MSESFNEDSGASAVALLSGGLDSTLAIKILQEKGIKIYAINFVSPFCLCDRKKGCPHIAEEVGKRLKVPVKTASISREYVSVLQNPKHGYGRNMNPCLDCRILMFKKAKEYMKSTGSSFIVTGEVLGQRPMSQQLRSMRLIEREAGVEGLVVRPLSGGLLKPTIAERSGFIKRDWLLKLRGRSRKPQMGMAEGFGIDYYPCAAGGCLLTDPSFVPRVRDLLDHSQRILVNDLHLLRYGRHFRLSPETKAIVGRCQEENRKLQKFARSDDFLFEALDYTGPITLVRGGMRSEEAELVARIHARYTDVPDGQLARVGYHLKGQSESSKTLLEVLPAVEDDISSLRI